MLHFFFLIFFIKSWFPSEVPSSHEIYYFKKCITISFFFTSVCVNLKLRIGFGLGLTIIKIIGTYFFNDSDLISNRSKPRLFYRLELLSMLELLLQHNFGVWKQQLFAL
jgi:hypothetical protein